VSNQQLELPLKGGAKAVKKDIPKWLTGAEATPLEYKQAYEVYTAAIATMIIEGDRALYAYLLMRFKRIFSTKDVPTMGVSAEGGQINLWINPLFVLSLTQKQIQAVIEHEFLHLVMMHPIRMPNTSELTLWNLACDVCVNEFIDNNNLPANGITWDGFAKQYKNFPPKFSSANVYYQFLRQKAEQDGELKMPGGGKAKTVMVDDHSKWGNESEESEAPEGAGESQEVSKKFYESMIKGELKEAHQRVAGNIPGHIRSLIRRMLNSDVPWNVVLRRFITSTRNSTRRYTLKRYNRRLQLPPGYCRERKLNLCTIIDTSGSIDNKQLAAFLNELNIISKYKNTEITVIEADAEVNNMYKFKTTQTHEFKGRGGTDFRPAFDYITKKKLVFDGVIYFTDGYGPAPTNKPKYPVLWVYTKDHEKAAPWGASVVMRNT